MELHYRREAAVGLLLIVGAVGFTLGLMWFTGRSLRKGNPVRILFADVSGLKTGDPVRTSGVQVGRVREVVLESVGRVVAYVTLDPDVAPRTDARAVVRSLDFFGARYVDYFPGSSRERLDPRKPIIGEREADIGEIAAGITTQSRGVLSGASEVLAGASEVLSPRTATELRATLVEAQRALIAVGSATQGPSREAAAALAALRQLFEHADTLLGGEQVRGTLGDARRSTMNLVQATATLQRSAASLDSIVGAVNSRRGSLGRFINDTTLAADLHNVSAALTDLLSDIKANPRRYISVRVF